MKILVKKLVVAGSFTINLGILFFFKYLDFFFENINSLLGIMKVRPINNGLDLLLPVGISFYTFRHFHIRWMFIAAKLRP